MSTDISETKYAKYSGKEITVTEKKKKAKLH